VSFYELLNRIIAYCEQNEIPHKFRPSRGILPGAIESIDKVRDRVSRETADRFSNLQGDETPLLQDVLGARAVITTPSTVSVESMALGRPLCHLLFDSETVYLPSAWAIRKSDDIPEVIGEILNPPRFKMPYQEVIFEENVSCFGTSAAEVAKLIQTLAISG
jgi:hypothetical protein